MDDQKKTSDTSKNTSTFALEKQKQRAHRRLGTTEPRCIVCLEDDWRCLELQHLAGRVYDDQTVILCRNCHRKQSTPQENGKQPEEPPILDRIAHWLLGLAVHFRDLADKAECFGRLLLDGARQLPQPWGWQVSQGGAA